MARLTALLVSLASSLALSACGKDEPKKPPTGAAGAPHGTKPSGAHVLPDIVVAPSLDRAEGIVASWFEAAGKADLEAMLALGTPEWREKERAGAKAFSPAVARGAIKVKTFKIRPAIGDGDQGTVSVKAVFTDEKGRDDPEAMRFQVLEKDGRWWITAIE